MNIVNNLHRRIFLCAMPLTLCTAGPGKARAQSGTHITWLNLMAEPVSQRVLLLNVADSGVRVMDRVDRLGGSERYVSDAAIASLQFRKKGSVGKGALIVGTIGSVVSLISLIGSGGYAEPVAIIAPIAGVGLGAWIGSARVTLNIGGDHGRFQRLRSSIDAYAGP